VSIRLFCSDLDGTLIGNPAATALFMRSWNAVPEDRRPLLVYNSGRLIEDVAQLVGDGKLPEPDYLIGGVGTEIVDYRNKTVLENYQEQLADGWDRTVIDDCLRQVPQIECQPSKFQNPYKLSWWLEEASSQQIEQIQNALQSRGQQVNVVYSSNRDLDILPAKASKGHALRWLCEYLDIPTDQVLVAGDRGNDISMFVLPGVRGILVDNAQPELFEKTVDCPVYHSERLMGEGIVDGLCHFGVLARPACSEPASDEQDDPEMRLLFDPKHLRHLNPDQHDLLDTAYRKAIETLHKNITPIGFSACSLEENEVIGTDVNYRSVWGRDGAISVINSLDLDDDAIHQCQRKTLCTLLDRTSEYGQVPANVRIETGEPDYSGIGGIAAIDSGLWLVIAVYHYVKRMEDVDFYLRYADTIDRIMSWLQAQDSNADGLLEIPEASDWTDLFGRSYNVLYDEVLWYRANVCYGHLLEMGGRHEASARCMARSQHIRGRILRVFWPSTTLDEDKTESSFAERQYSLGDARYLLAEVSPFNFSWRCDVYGNILGFLTNVIDVPRARRAFSFMWGVGANQPWPVSNLYPVVQAGDPDWRPYYTVNLLNLPHHYHNGGIWPFVGGMWVRFIHRLGQHDVACQELVRLAECCRQGRSSEWEFNEWCHGVTGRPMGKVFQCWSAACFVRACHELQVLDDEPRGDT